MTDKMYIEKINRLEEILKSQKAYDYMIGLMAIRVKNRLPKEEKNRQIYDLKRIATLGKTNEQTLVSREQKELAFLLNSSTLVQQYALWKVGAEYGSCGKSKDLQLNLKRINQYGSYSARIGQQTVKIPADKIRTMEY